MKLALVLLLTALAAIITVIDFRRYRIPLWANAAVLISGVVWTTQYGAADFWLAALQAVALLGLLVGLRSLYRLRRSQTGLGMGDVLFMTAASLWLTPFQLPLFLLLASSSALIYAAFLWLLHIRTEKIPFGPFLCLALVTLVVLKYFQIDFMEASYEL